MSKQQFKEKVLLWLAENNIFPKRVRGYDNRRYGFEVRVYNEPMEFPNIKSSFRRTEAEKDEKGNITGWNGTRGIHSKKISTYTHINAEDLKNENEKKFILDVIKDNLTPTKT